MAVRNGAPALRLAVESILDQTLSDFEFLIMDDGSTDDVPAVLGEYARRDKRVRVLRNERSQGLPASLNTLLHQARGEFLARMDADDVSLPERLERQLKHLEEHPDVTVVGCRYRVFRLDPAESRIDPVHDRHYRCDGIRDGRPPIPHPTAVARVDDLHSVGGYNPWFITAQDHDLWERLYARGARFHMMTERLFLYRVHATSNSRAKMRRTVANSLRVNLRAIFRHRIRFTIRGYVYVMMQLAYFAWLTLLAALRWAVAVRRSAVRA